MDQKKDDQRYSSGVMASVPVIRGTRVPLSTLIAYLKDERGIEGFLADHPQVTGAQVNRSLILALEALANTRKEFLGADHDKPGKPSRGAR